MVQPVPGRSEPIRPFPRDVEPPPPRRQEPRPVDRDVAESSEISARNQAEAATPRPAPQPSRQAAPPPRAENNQDVGSKFDILA